MEKIKIYLIYLDPLTDPADEELPLLMEAPPLTDPLDGEEIELDELLEIFEDELLIDDE